MHVFFQTVKWTGWAILGLCTIFSCQSDRDAEAALSFEPNRFLLENLCTNLNEPFDLGFLPDGRILFTERRGILKMYDPQSEVVKVVGEIPVHYINENGLLGMAIDPAFIENNWLYFFYTDPERLTYQQISRFDFRNDSLILGSEKKLLDFYVDINNCCHFGGSLDFGPDGLLYISSGDNVGGTDFGPHDERPGQYLGDAQRSSANTMDLRGKILRIRPERDGSYNIPEGNLFPPGTPKTRPEIYVMGVRNPLKLDVDQETGWLIWGEVGPNPGKGDPKRGPRSHEEINLAKSAGNFGWPYLIGDNKPYFNYDYASGEIGAAFDPEYLINDSPNNTGIQKLPPGQKALVWYPNELSDTFPLTGEGGGTVGAGPIYHFDEKLESGVKFPKYFDKKLFIYEWMRSWVLAVSLDGEGNYVGMEAFLSGTPFKKPIDIRFGPDGAMYVLDYGSNWYAHNPDARLTRVSYVYGNRAPVAQFEADIIEGKAPLRVQFSAENSFDHDEGDQLNYFWNFGEEQGTSTEMNPEFSFTTPGKYEVKLLVQDSEGLSSEVTQMIRVGNDPPEIELQIAGNQSFFKPGKHIQYTVRVKDTEDGASGDGSIEPETVDVRLRRLPGNTVVKDLAEAAIGDIAHLRGKGLMAGSDCYACHAMDQKSVGPSLMAISRKYLDDTKAQEYLSEKVLKGGKGVWGEQLMTAHPQHTPEQANAMAQYILSLNQKQDLGQALALKGNFATPEKAAVYVLSAAYKDRGTSTIAPIKREKRVVLRSPLIPAASSFDYSFRVSSKPYNDAGDLYGEIALNGSYVGYKSIDLSGVELIRVKLRSTAGFIRVDVRQSSAEGPLVASKRVDLVKKDNWALYAEKDWFYIDLPIVAGKGIADLYFVFFSDKKESDYIYFDICQLHSIEFIFGQLQ